MVKPVLKAARSIPMDDGRIILPLRTRARLDYIAGRRDDAIAKLSQLLDCAKRIGPRGETVRDEYALAVMIGGEQGNVVAAQCERRLREAGCVDPLQDLFSYYPELRTR